MAREIWKKGLRKGWEEIDGVLYHEGLLYLHEIIRIKIINRQYDDPLVCHFGVEKTKELVTQKYYWPTLQVDNKAYVKGWDVCITLKAIKHKPYGDVQSLPVYTHRWNDLSMDFVTGLPVSTNKMGQTYDSIFIIIDRLNKMVYYKQVKVTIDAPDLVEVMIEVVVRHYGWPDSVVSD